MKLPIPIEVYAAAAIIFGIAIGVSYLFALAGEPQSEWFWRMIGVLY